MKRLPIGVENFEKIRKDGFYYVDKTGLIRELLAHRGEVTLFTRPRRFGKSLNMNMLKYFFGQGGAPALFEGLEIAGEKELCEQYMGKFPVILVSLKDVQFNNYETARDTLCAEIGNTAMRFQFLAESNHLSELEKEQYRNLVKVGKAGQASFDMTDEMVTGGLRLLRIFCISITGKRLFY